jgi:hypothetical protein
MYEKMSIWKLKFKSLFLTHPTTGWFDASLLAVSTYIYTAFVSLHIDPPAAGWIQFPLGNKRLVPYRDYFNPVPPLSYFESQITSAPNYGLHNIIILGCVTFACLSITTYFMTRRFFGRCGSLLITVFAVTLLQSLRLEQAEGWNTQFFIYLGIALNCLLLAVLPNSNKKPPSEGNNRQFLMLSAISGLFFSFATLEKQTTAFSVIVLVVGLSIYIYRNKDLTRTKKIRSYLKISSICFFIPHIFSIYWLIKNGALLHFIQDMKSGGGKSPRVTSSIWNLLIDFNQYLPMRWLFLPILFIFIAYSHKEKKLELVGFLKFESSQYLLVPCFAFIYWFNHSGFSDSHTLMVEFGSALITGLLYNLRRNSRISPRITRFLLICSIFLFPFIEIFNNSNTFLSNISTVGINTGSFISFCLLIFSIAGTLNLLNVLPRISQIWPLEKILNFFQLTPELSFAVYIANLATLGSLINVLSSGGGVYPQWFIPQFLIYFATANYLAKKYLQIEYLRGYLKSLVALTSIGFVGLTLMTPYAWFNWSESDLLHNRFVAINSSNPVPGNYGLWMSPSTYKTYSKLAFVGQRVKISNASFPLTVFSFPNIPNFAVATGLVPYDKLRCSVLWFDVCPNAVASKDLQVFKKTEPSLIVWQDIPESLIQGNEKAFVHGRSALREWIAYKDQKVKEGDWHLIDSFTAPSSNGWRTELYVTAGINASMRN